MILAGHSCDAWGTCPVTAPPEARLIHMRVRSTVAGHPVIFASALAAVVGLAIFVLAYFEPQKLFIDDRVHEPPPTVASGQSSDGGSGTGERRAPAAPADQGSRTEVLAGGAFQSYEHPTSGRAQVLRIADGSRYLRLESFETSNGPDVRVYLSAAPAGGDGDAFDDDYVELGELKGNIGNQNYAIPADLGLRRFPSAVIWCKRFSVAFGTAPLQ